jgi:large-conductance mechanosensitive channel
LVGGATAAAVRAVVDPGADMALAMLVGMALGMVVHLPIALLLSPLLGPFHTMVPGSLIGMYGGMLFAMRDTMQHAPGGLSDAIVMGIAFGCIVTAGVQLYDRAVRGGASTAVEEG